jgi:hypothetical protein
MSKVCHLLAAWFFFFAVSAIVVLFESSVRESALGNFVFYLVSFPGLMLSTIFCGVHGCSESFNRVLIVLCCPMLGTMFVSLFMSREK